MHKVDSTPALALPPPTGESGEDGLCPGVESPIARHVYVGNLLVGVVAAVVFGGLVWFFGQPPSEATSQAVTVTAQPAGAPPRIGRTAPDFHVASLDGDLLRLSDFRGRPVWITFWASWCPPCRAESSDIQAAHERYRDAGLVILAIDVGEDPGTIRDYLERAGITFTVALDTSTDVAALYRVAGVPSHYFIDRDGVLRDSKIGAIGEKAIDRKLQALLLSNP
jgi:cytochrome c biogenesis protein CcmG/thiol:disulfide interchange protein DsbE